VVASGYGPGVSLRQLKWTTIIAPLVFLAVVDLIRRNLQPELMQSWPGELLVAGVVLFGVLLFSETVFGRIERMQARLGRQNRELLALHDSLAQVLGYVNTKAQAVQELLKRGQNDRASAQVGQLGEAARAAYADVRESILALRTSVGLGRGVVDALQQFLERWTEQSDVEAFLQVQPPGASLDTLPPAAELQLLRVVQEALANVRKHAQAEHVEVRITPTADEVETVIADDGRSFVVGQERPGDDRMPHFGLSTMRERAESVGGTLDIVSAPSEGTRVVVRLPARSTTSLDRSNGAQLRP
jgi:signal transduction histidine kinase